jgi:hypothetical protein
MVDEPSTFTRTAKVVSFTMMTEALAGPLVDACDGDAAIEADVEGLALGVVLGFADGFAVWLGFGIALGFGVALGFVVAVDLELVSAAVGLAVADVTGVGFVASTKGVGGAGCGIVELGTATGDETGVDEAGVSVAGMFVAGTACALVLECARREIATVPMTRMATPAAAPRAVMIPRPRDGDSPDCDNCEPFSWCDGTSAES